MKKRHRLSPKQAASAKDRDHRWNIKTGATRSGKTFSDLTYTIPHRLLIDYPFDVDDDGLIVLIGNTPDSLYRNVLAPLRSLWKPHIVHFPKPSNGTVRLFGHECHILGADSAARVKALQGASIRYCYGDEITTWSQEVFEMLKSRMDRPDSRFDGTCNPAGPHHWLHRFLQSDADILHQRFTLDDNPYLPPNFSAALKAEYAGTVYYDRYILGRWTLAEGLVYRGFSHEKHVSVEVPPLQTISFGIDVGHVNATVFLAIGEGADGRAWVIDEYHHSGRDGAVRSPLGYARDFVRFEAAVRRAHPGARCAGVYIDPSAAGFMQQLREAGVTALYRARNDVLEGIAAVSSLLEADRLRIMPRCHTLLDELAAYRWDDTAAAHGIDRPVKENDHALDALRYWVLSRRKAHGLQGAGEG